MRNPKLAHILVLIEALIVHRAEKDAYKKKMIRCTVLEFLNH